MAWVRYDDQLSLNAKVTAALLEDPGVMSLHLMANTWTSTQKKHPGYIPVHQPGALIFDRTLGPKWADILVRNNLWHERGKECERCAEAYADAPTSPGYVVHDFKDYRPPASERQTPGTPADLSEKRAAAGRAGGKATAKQREQEQQKPRANQANAPSKSSNAASNPPSPVPVPVPVPESQEPQELFPPPAVEAKPELPPDRFDEFYSIYPRKKDPRDARKAWDQAVKAGADPQGVIAGARQYRAERAGKDPQYTAYPASWLRAEGWRSEPDLPPPKTSGNRLRGQNTRDGSIDWTDPALKEFG